MYNYYPLGRLLGPLQIQKRTCSTHSCKVMWEQAPRYDKVNHSTGTAVLTRATVHQNICPPTYTSAASAVQYNHKKDQLAGT